MPSRRHVCHGSTSKALSQNKKSQVPSLSQHAQHEYSTLAPRPCQAVGSTRPPQCLHAKGFVCLILVSQSSDQGHAAVPGSCKAEYACRANDTTAFVREECKIMQSVVQCYLSVTTAVCYMLQCPILPEILDHSNAPRVRFDISMLCETLNLVYHHAISLHIVTKRLQQPVSLWYRVSSNEQIPKQTTN